eukprot:scaffold8195_cov156-Amphora_coffeaeformis.AAC.1
MEIALTMLCCLERLVAFFSQTQAAIMSIPECNILLMNHQGFACFGKSVKEAWVLAYYFERACDIQYHMMTSDGKAKLFSNILLSRCNNGSVRLENLPQLPLVYSLFLSFLSFLHSVSACFLPCLGVSTDRVYHDLGNGTSHGAGCHTTVIRFQ